MIKKEKICIIKSINYYYDDLDLGLDLGLDLDLDLLERDLDLLDKDLVADKIVSVRLRRPFLLL